MPRLLPTAVLLTLSLLGACAQRGPTTLAVAPGDYPVALEAARDCLRDYGFVIDRVDAAAGVVTTRPKRTAGLATPWDIEQSTLVQEWEDFMNRHERTVRVDFEPEGAEGAGEVEDGGVAPALTDLRAEPQPLKMRLTVSVDRGYHSGWRIESSSIRQSTFYWDRDLARRGMVRYEVPIVQDDLLAARLTADIERQMKTLKKKEPTTEAAGS